MRILVVSQYYRPEVGATQNRMGAFVDGLRERGHRVTVLCEQANHPEGVFHPGHGRRPVQVGRGPAGDTIRLWVKASPEKSKLSRAAFYGTFAAGAGATVAAMARHDVAFITSPPLPGAFAAAAASRLRGVPFVLDVRDLWPAAAEALGELSDRRLVRGMERMESWLYRRAARVTTTTEPFRRHIDAIGGRPVSALLPNGASDSLLAANAELPAESTPFVVGYAGNLGVAQGLDIVLDAAQRLREEEVEFRLIGAGPLASQLRERARELGLDRVTFRGTLSLAEVGEAMRACHALLVPLRARELLGDFIPSKLYDAMAVGRPVIAAAGRETAAEVERTGCGLVVQPEDGEALAEAVIRLKEDRASAERMAAAGLRAVPGHLRSAQVERLESILEEAAGG